MDHLLKPTCKPALANVSQTCVLPDNRKSLHCKEVMHSAIVLFLGGTQSSCASSVFSSLVMCFLGTGQEQVGKQPLMLQTVQQCKQIDKGRSGHGCSRGSADSTGSRETPPELLGDQELELFRLQQVEVLAQSVPLLHRPTVGQSQVPQLVHMLEEQALHLYNSMQQQSLTGEHMCCHTSACSSSLSL